MTEKKTIDIRLLQYGRGNNRGGLLDGIICPTISVSNWQNNCILIEIYETADTNKHNL